MSETKTEFRSAGIMSARQLMDKLEPEETFTMKVRGFYLKTHNGKTNAGRKFTANSIFFMPMDENELTISMSQESAGGKTILKQMDAWREQKPGMGELGHYASTVEFKHVTQIKDRETGDMMDVDFLSARIIPKSVGERMFTPSSATFDFGGDNTENQLDSF